MGRAKAAAVGADVVEGMGWMDPATLTPWDRNPRLNDGAVDAVAHSITTLGFGAPLVVRIPGFVVVAGHTRLKAALKLGLDKVPVRTMELTDVQAKALALADNKLGEIGQWDDEALAGILGEIDDELIPGLGWTDDELGTLLERIDLEAFEFQEFNADEKPKAEPTGKKVTVEVVCPECSHRFPV